MKDRVGALRRSHVVNTYGPGAIIDLRTRLGAPVSGVLAGLEEWDRAAHPGPGGMLHLQHVHEPRLEGRLKVDGFRLPPVKATLRRDKNTPDNNRDVLPVVRFPEWLQCPGCNRIQRAGKWSKVAVAPERWCSACTRRRFGSDDGREKVWAVPVRFVVACEDGHLDEFPWEHWIGCSCELPQLYFDMDAPGLSGKKVRCHGCGKVRSMEGCFGKEALSQRGLSCRGREPWLPPPDEQRPACGKVPRVLQRGASNVYWGIQASAIDIPPFSTDLSDIFGALWSDMKAADEADWPDFIRLHRLEKKTGRPAAELLGRLREWKAALESSLDPRIPLEWAEYLKFRESLTGPIVESQFQTAPEPAPALFGPWLDGVVLASRLREVRAQVGFTRINPEGGMFGAANQTRGRIFLVDPDWRPAIELRGEGIFLRLSPERLASWESRPEVVRRAARHAGPVARRLHPNDPSATVTPALAARFLMVHALAHALMRRLSLSCGYSSSALRERLYVGEGVHDMAGILIHTGAPDAEGTLGGLVRQGRQDRLEETLIGALQDMAWCASDPVCISGAATLSSPLNGAACHACLLAPETSCQHFNVLLDRALLVGKPEEPELGYFAGWEEAEAVDVAGDEAAR